MSSLCPFAKLASAGATCPVKSDNKTTSCPVTANNHTDDDDNEKTGNANTDPRVVPAKCPFGYDSNNTFKLGPLSCVVCHALLHQSSKCTPCSHKFCKACILRFKDCPLCGADIQGIEPDDELQGLVDRFIDGHARIKRSHAAGDGEAASDKTKVIYEHVSMERGAFLVQQAMRAFRAQNIESAKSRLSMCAEDIREELKSKEDNQELCSQLGAVLGMLGDCCRTLGDAPSAITYYEESAEFLSKLPKKDLELVHTLSVSLNKIGDLRYYDGDLHSARSYYARSLDVRRSAAKEHSAVASQVIDVATSLAKVADVDRNLGNESMAVEGFEEAKGKSSKQHSKNWVKKVQADWKILENDLPEAISVRACESRMDLLRAVIIGAEGTPYHDGLFFFDIQFPDTYPSVPPNVHYHSGGLRINPNLYNCGKVCLSLLGTWAGSAREKWLPNESTMLQLLVSIQALILNEKPYFNEPGYVQSAGTASGESKSKVYSENVFLLSLKTMVYSIRRPPQHFEEYVQNHYFVRSHDIVKACNAYKAGAPLGSMVKGGVQDLEEARQSGSKKFKTDVASFMQTVVDEFVKLGVKELAEKPEPPMSNANTENQSKKKTRKRSRSSR